MPSLRCRTTLADPIQFVPERSAARFVALQKRFYVGDPHFAAPIPMLEAWQCDPKKSPFVAHGEAELWVARRGTEVVGRISAARDRLHDEFHGDKIGFFGHFEARDEATAHALLETASRWLREHGADVARGPIDFSTNYKIGLLVSGEPGLPGLMMPHNPPSYAGWIESFGMHKSKDVIALLVRREVLHRERMRRLSDRLRERTGATMRLIDLGRFWEEVELLWQLYNAIWEKNWGFAPMSRDEFRRQAKDLKGIARKELIIFAEAKGKPVGFVIALPDITYALQRCQGSLFPFGWLHLLRARTRAKGMRVLTLGVVPEYRKSGLDALLLQEIVDRAYVLGIETCDCSWILEDNELMLRPLIALGGSEYRRYRIYERALR